MPILAKGPTLASDHKYNCKTEKQRVKRQGKAIATMNFHHGRHRQYGTAFTKTN